MQVIERKLQEIGESLLVTLPKDWTTTLKLKKGSHVKMMVSEQGTLVIAPEFIAKEEIKTVSIPLDDHFQRRFFREYFHGFEQITFQGEGRRKELYGFLKHFLNVQVIEETTTKVTVKCFRIEELSIEECLRRMYFLILNMFDEVLGKNDTASLAEMEETLTKFYYMLVMQVRRFLSEGKYVKENKVPLIRILDCRMVAEKMERLADVLKTLGHPKKKDILLWLRDYYRRAGIYFVDMDYGKSLELYETARLQGSVLSQELESARKTKNLQVLEQIMGMQRILALSKEISMLVR